MSRLSIYLKLLILCSCLAFADDAGAGPLAELMDFQVDFAQREQVGGDRLKVKVKLSPQVLRAFFFVHAHEISGGQDEKSTLVPSADPRYLDLIRGGFQVRSDTADRQLPLDQAEEVTTDIFVPFRFMKLAPGPHKIAYTVTCSVLVKTDLVEQFVLPTQPYPFALFADGTVSRIDPESLSSPGVAAPAEPDQAIVFNEEGKAPETFAVVPLGNREIPAWDRPYKVGQLGELLKQTAPNHPGPEEYRPNLPKVFEELVATGALPPPAPLNRPIGILSVIKDIEQARQAEDQKEADELLKARRAAAVTFRVVEPDHTIDREISVGYYTNRKVYSGDTPDKIFPPDLVRHEPGKLTGGFAKVFFPGSVHKRGLLETAGFWSRIPKEKAFSVRSVEPGPQEILRGNKLTIFIHGFNTSFLDAILQTVQLAEDIRPKTSMMAFCWPSFGSAFYYIEDRIAIEKNAVGLAEFIEKLRRERWGENDERKDDPNQAELNVVVHSMGNEVFTTALDILNRQNRLPYGLFNRVTLAAPDVAIKRFEEILPAVVYASKSVVHLHSGWDVPIYFSKWANIWKKRAGATAVWHPKVISISVNRVNSPFLRLGHGYFAASDRVLTFLKRYWAGETPEQMVGLLGPKTLRLRGKDAQGRDGYIDRAIWEILPN